MRSKIIVLASVCLLAGCAGITQHPKVAAIGSTAVFVQSKNTKRVVSKLAEGCDREGFQIDETTATSVTCSREAPIMAQAFLGTKYGTDVRSQLRFTALSLDGGTKITRKTWFENQTAFGQTRKHEVDGGEAADIALRIMQEAKAGAEGR